MAGGDVMPSFSDLLVEKVGQRETLNGRRVTNFGGYTLEHSDNHYIMTADNLTIDVETQKYFSAFQV